jgi:chromosome segregation ATPase
LSKKENDNLLEQIFQLKSVISSKDELIEVLQNQKSVIASENAELLTIQNDLNSQVETLSQIDTSEIDELKLKSASLQEANQQLTLEVEMFQNLISVLKDEKIASDNIKIEWQDTFTQNTNLKFELDQRALEAEQWHVKTSEWEIALSKKGNTIELLEKSIETLGSQLSEQIHKGEIVSTLQNQNTLLQSEIEVLKTQLETSNQNTTSIDELTIKNLQLVAVTNDLVREKMETQWEIAQMKTKEEEWNNANDTVRDTINDLNSKVTNLSTTNTKLIEEIDFTKNFINVIENQNKELLDTINTLNLNNSVLKEQLITWEKTPNFDFNDIENLQNQLKEQKDEMLQWEAKAFEVEKEKENLELELDMLKQQFTELEDNLSALKSSQSKLADHRTTLFTQSEIVEKDYESEMALQLEHEQLQENYDKLNQKFNNQSETQKHLESMNNSLKLAKNTTADTEDTSVLKERINQLVGEIDKCIDLLSNN